MEALFVILVLFAFGAQAKAVSDVMSDEMTNSIVELKTVRGHFMRSDAARAFDRAVDMSDVPRVTSSFRTRQQQEALYALFLSGKGNLAAKPGTSKHEFGLAIDARGSAQWEMAMEANGFKRTVSSEPWHWEFRS